MKKITKIWIAVLSVVLFIGVAIAGVCIWLFSPGIHVIGPLAHLDAQEKCYIIDYATGEILGESVLTVKCDINAVSNTFSGSICLQNYPVQGEIASDLAVRTHEGYIAFMYSGITWSNAQTGEVDPEIDSGYSVYVKDANHLFAVVHTEEKAVLAVCADNEQQAKELARTAFYLYWGQEPRDW